MKSVFFTGAGGQGKTTTANLIAPILGVPITDGLSRGNPHPMGSTEGQDWLAYTVFLNCVIQQTRIHCRTPIDVYAYSQAYEKGDLSQQQDYIEAWLKTKPKIVYFPYLFKIEDDGFRPTDDTLATSVDEEIWNQLNKYAMRNSRNIHIASNAPPEQRAKEILSFLSYN